MWQIRYWLLLLALCFVPLAYVSAMDSQTVEAEPSQMDYEIELPPWKPSVITPSLPPLTIESNLTGLENLLDNWEMDSLTLWLELQKLQTIVEELKSTLTQSETLAEGLATSLASEQSKTQRLRRWLTVSVITGAVLTTGSVIWALSR